MSNLPQCLHSRVGLLHLLRRSRDLLSALHNIHCFTVLTQKCAKMLHQINLMADPKKSKQSFASTAKVLYWKVWGNFLLFVCSELTVAIRIDSVEGVLMVDDQYVSTFYCSAGALRRNEFVPFPHKIRPCCGFTSFFHAAENYWQTAEKTLHLL